jgi:hypothetical protein
MNEPYLPYGHQLVDADNVQVVVNALRDDWLTTVNASHGVSFSSGIASHHSGFLLYLKS